ncbi:MAG: cysteine desulfurase [Patescibacteria group bacterium]|nr:cysteine desulfurase [Patescibacteria group bacterium]MCL5095868.1 cysteine desulfurase [Patescibacteria group bacterium]
MLDTQKIRSDFPILKRKINGKLLIYLDSTASSLKPQLVLSAMDEYYTKFGVNIFRGLYKLSQEATEAYEEARQKVASFIGSQTPKEVIFVRNTTEAVNLVATAWGMANIDKQSEIICTVMEHHSNFLPWQQLAKNKGARIKYLDIDQDGKLKTQNSKLNGIVTRKTKLIALTHVSNVLGTINPIREISQAVKKINPDCLVFVDAAQSVPHLPIDVCDLGCDFLAFSGHKMLGPVGIGVLWGKKKPLDEMPPYQYGGEMIKDVFLEQTTFAESPAKFEAGTPNIAGAIGLGAAVSYLQKVGMENVRKHELLLTDYALKQLGKIANLTVYGPKKAEERGGVIAFNVSGIHPHDLAQILDEDNLCLRSGQHCAMPLHQRLGISASCRVSFYVYNTGEEIDKLIKGIKKAQKIFKV